jgi:hypothetical protein
MAGYGFLQRAFGIGSNPANDTTDEPNPGIGGFTDGAGPANQTGFPGSTSQTRSLRGRSPRSVGIRADTDTGTQTITETRRQMQSTPATQAGGPMLKTGQGNNTAGGQTLSPSKAAGGHSAIDTTTPLSKAGFPYIQDAPGSSNVRNTIAERYKAVPGQSHTYRSAARPDQAQVNVGGQATDGNVHPERVTQDVTVQNRFTYPNQGWAVAREMPYSGRGGGARGAALNGDRYYATGQDTQFWNGGAGDYGIARQNATPSAVSFTQPAPWSAQAYTTTADIGSAGSPNQSPGQQPNAVVMNPSGGRSSNSTQRG